MSIIAARIFVPVITVVFLLSTWTHDAIAQTSNTRQVGPQTFHKKIEIPRTLGRNIYNNEDSFIPDTNRHKNRHERHKNRKNNRGQDASSETRTQSDTAGENRIGRRDRQSRPSNAHMRKSQRQTQGTTNLQGVNN